MLLLKNGANKEAVNNSFDKTALMMASGAGHTKTVKALLKAGVNKNALDNASQTALMWAAHQGHTKTVRALLEKGADVNISNIFGGTALMWAAHQGPHQKRSGFYWKKELTEIPRIKKA